MKNKIITFDDALKMRGKGHTHLLLGNGFSIAWRKDIFRYDSLFKQADFTNLNSNAIEAFKIFSTDDFEIIMKALRDASKLVRIYSKKDKKLAKQLEEDANKLKEILLKAIAMSHPESPADITEDEYLSCINFLKNFGDIYTLNYDLLLYWVIMKAKEQIKFDDGFRTPNSGKAGYVSWDIEKTNGQNIFYLHGALHIFDAGAEIQKYTWINTGIKLIKQIRGALVENYYPLIVSEGESIEKLTKIRHSDYLSRSMRSFSQIGGNLFIYGHSLASNDNHIIDLIASGKVENLFISIHGDPESESNKRMIDKTSSLKSLRKNKHPLEINFYDAETAKIWE